MKGIVILVFLLAVVAGHAGAADNAVSVGLGQGAIVPGERINPCPGSQLFQNDDASFENGYAWQYGGVVPPFYGAFAEGYEPTGGYDEACGIQAMLTTLEGYYQGSGADWYVFYSDGVNPTSIASITPNVSPGQPGIWPNITAHDIDVIDTPVSGGLIFVGYWGNWPGASIQWFVAVDLDGFGGTPRANIAPGIGYPTGWQDTSVVWGPTQALGIRAYLWSGGIIPPPDDPPPNPVRETTWGAIKRLHR